MKKAFLRSLIITIGVIGIFLVCTSTLFAQSNVTELFSFRIPEGFEFRGHAGEGSNIHDEQDPFTVLSPNRQKVAFILHNKLDDVGHEEYVVTIDRKGQMKESKRYRGVTNVQFNHDGSLLTYIAEELNPEKSGPIFSVVINEENIVSGPMYPRFIFSSDGTKYAYEVRKDKSVSYVLSSGEKTPSHATITSFIFSPDSKHYAYAALDYIENIEDGNRIFVDGKVLVTQYGVTSIGNLVFSPDSKRIMFAANEGSGKSLQMYKISNGKKLKQYNFSPLKDLKDAMPADFMTLGQKIRSVPAFFTSKVNGMAYIEQKFKVQKSSIYKALDGEYALINGKKGKKYDMILSLTLGLNGSPIMIVEGVSTSSLESLIFNKREHDLESVSSARFYIIPGRDNLSVAGVQFGLGEEVDEDEEKIPEYKIFFIADGEHLRYAEGSYRYLYDVEYSKDGNTIIADALDISSAPEIKVLHIEIPNQNEMDDTCFFCS